MHEDALLLFFRGSLVTFKTQDPWSLPALLANPTTQKAALTDSMNPTVSENKREAVAEVAAPLPKRICQDLCVFRGVLVLSRLRNKTLSIKHL